MPDWLRIFAENQPISQIANAVRGLFLNTVAVEEVLVALGWIVLITIIFMPLAVRQYRRSV